jgi:virginiamycin B lyase
MSLRRWCSRVLSLQLLLGALTYAQAPTSATIPADSALRRARIPLDQLPIVARIDLPTSADWMAFGFASVWIVNYRPDRVSRVDPSNNRVVADIPIGRNGCLGILATADRVWVPTCGDSVVN